MTTPQAPIGSGFGAASTTRDVIEGFDLAGKVAIVTGGYSGLGLETVRTLRSAGAAVIVPTRDPGKAQAALGRLRLVPGPSLSPVVFEDPNFEHRDYDPWAAYGQSKTANILFGVALDARGQSEAAAERLWSLSVRLVGLGA